MDKCEAVQLQQMLFAAAGGDEAAWRRLVDAYSGRVFALLHAQCRDPELAEDLTQSTFCTVVRKLPDYTEVGRFESWLFRIAMNRLRDEMRRRARHASSVDHETLSAMGHEQDAVDAPGDRAQDLLRLREAMAALPDADREILHLRHYAELSFRQIAEMLDQPLGTVLARQHRAIRKLADLLEDTERSDKTVETGERSRKSTQ